jgi:Tol biopolymer transport system component
MAFTASRQDFYRVRTDAPYRPGMSARTGVGGLVAAAVVVVSLGLVDGASAQRSLPPSRDVPAWSPSGRQIAYVVRYGPQSRRYDRVMVMSASGGAGRVLAQFGRSVYVSDIRFAGNSRLVVALADQGALCTIDIHTRKVVALGPVLGGIGNGTCNDRGGPLSLGANDNFSVSANGRRVAYTGDSPYANDNKDAQGFLVDDFAIGVVSSPGVTGHMLPEPIDASDAYPSFSPDGTRVVFARSFITLGITSAPSLMVQSASGGQARPLNIQGDHPVWSPNGRWIVFQYRSTQEGHTSFPDGLGIVSASGGSPHTLLHTAVGDGLALSWSPDSQRVAFITESGQMGTVTPVGKVTYFSLDGLSPDVNYSINGFPGRPPQWSPDGKTLLFSVTVNRRNNLTRIYAIGSDGRGLHPVG